MFIVQVQLGTCVFTSDASRELISREFSRMNFEIILENELFILEKWRKNKSTLICRFEELKRLSIISMSQV